MGMRNSRDCVNNPGVWPNPYRRFDTMNNTCSQADCGRHTHARGMCARHYNKLQRNGLLPDVKTMAPKNLSASERLAFHGWEVTPSGCHEWQGSATDDGYGTIRFEGQLWLAHRLSYVAANGPIPDGRVVRHRCDNPPCINPEHLLLGSIAENVDDCVRRGRKARGERVSTHKVTDAEVLAIQAASREGAKARELALKYGVSKSHITRIVAGTRRANPTNRVH